jgi:hypothetical protein
MPSFYRNYLQQNSSVILDAQRGKGARVMLRMSEVGPVKKRWLTVKLRSNIEAMEAIHSFVLPRALIFPSKDGGIFLASLEC